MHWLMKLYFLYCIFWNTTAHLQEILITIKEKVNYRERKNKKAFDRSNIYLGTLWFSFTTINKNHSLIRTFEVYEILLMVSLKSFRSLFCVICDFKFQDSSLILMKLETFRNNLLLYCKWLWLQMGLWWE